MDFFYDIKAFERRLNPIYKELVREVQLSAKRDAHYAGKVDITDILKPFTHISLDDNYRIVAYSSYEIHGPFGEAVAVENNKDIPEVYLEQEWSLFQRIIPDVCYPVEEVIFCDGTPEGFFEVIILMKVLGRLFQGYAEAYLDCFVFSADDIKKEENLLFKPSEYAPKYQKDDWGTCKLLLLQQSDNGSVELCEYNFSNRIPKARQTSKMYSHIKFEHGRFSDNKYCCCFSGKSICICEGEQSEYWV